MSGASLIVRSSTAFKVTRKTYCGVETTPDARRGIQSQTQVFHTAAAVCSNCVIDTKTWATPKSSGTSANRYDTNSGLVTVVS